MQSTLIPTDQVLEELAEEAARQVADLGCRRLDEPLDAERVEDIANGIWECFNAACTSNRVPIQEATSNYEPVVLPCTWVIAPKNPLHR